MHSYIVRIYRLHEAQNGLGMTGMVEAASGDRRWTFRTREELWEILCRAERDLEEDSEWQE